ncbi:MAG: SDR family NAD(P)-dependent oxidoreductase, partial [Gammaproteobacteria bacterium]|nr:SDR family NAD(P)-dependent oxidoreductase [Gammaproteobacteria bacterium]
MTQSVLVTAGGSGIGLAIAKAFLQTGADVHLVDQDQEALANVTQANPAFQATCIDVSDEQAVNETMAAHLSRLGRLDVLVNCAGIAGPTAGIENISLADWR